MSNEIAQIIINQLGGFGKLKAMINARNFVTDGDYKLTFHFSGSRLFNAITIFLNAMDTYDLRFMKLGKFDIIKELKTEGIYNDMLIDVFENTTKLRLSL